jgi:hypothetical protein
MILNFDGDASYKIVSPLFFLWGKKKIATFIGKKESG